MRGYRTNRIELLPDSIRFKLISKIVEIGSYNVLIKVTIKSESPIYLTVHR